MPETISETTTEKSDPRLVENLQQYNPQWFCPDLSPWVRELETLRNSLKPGNYRNDWAISRIERFDLALEDLMRAWDHLDLIDPAELGKYYYYAWWSLDQATDAIVEAHAISGKRLRRSAGSLADNLVALREDSALRVQRRIHEEKNSGKTLAERINAHRAAPHETPSTVEPAPRGRFSPGGWLEPA